MKGCLKQPSPIPSPVLECVHARKCVAFEADGSEQVFFADEWDRTPAEPCRKLSYQDLIELREIQRSLPLANQPPDPTTGRPARQYLSGVPITLLPLLPEPATHHHHHHHHNGTQINPSPSSGSNSTNPANFNATPGQAQGNFRTASPRNIIAAAAKASPASGQHPGTNAPEHREQYLPHHRQQPCLSGNFNPNHHYQNHFGKISNPTVRRLKPKFTFLPLLDTPPSSETTTPLTSNPSSRSASPDLTSDTDQTDPPTPSLTNASLDSPISCASSLSPEPTFLQLPPRHLSCGDDRCRPHFGPTDSYFPTTLNHDADDESTGSHRHLPPAAAAVSRPEGLPHRKRNVMIVNNMEIELDQEAESLAPAPSKPSSSNGSTATRKRNVIIVNDMEIELDDDGDDNQGRPSLGSRVDSGLGSVSLPDSALRDCNSTENLKPPERENGTKENSTSSTLAPSLLPSPPTSPTPSISSTSTLSPIIYHAPIGCHPTYQSAPSSPDNKISIAHVSADTGVFGSLHMPLRFKRRTMSTESSHLSPL